MILSSLFPKWTSQSYCEDSITTKQVLVGADGVGAEAENGQLDGRDDDGDSPR